LYQKLTNISDDIGSGIIKRTGTLKEASSGSGMTAHKKYGKLFDFYPYAKITYSANEPPELLDMSDAIRQRLKFVEFPYTFTKHPTGNEKPARDRKELLEELYGEIPGIINWALEGLKRFLSKNATFSESKTTDEAWKNYQRKSTPVLSFMEECITVTDNIDDNLTSEELYRCFNLWLKHNKIKLRVSRQKMMMDLKDEGIVTSSHREIDRKMRYYGISLSSRQALFSTVLSPQIELEEEVEEEVEEEGKQKGLDSLTPPEPSDFREQLFKQFGINPFKRIHALELFPEEVRDRVNKVIDRCLDQGELVLMQTSGGRDILQFLARQ
jgi:phage/plasmid-associated DNA primase